MSVKRIHRVKHKSRDFTQLENSLLRNTTLSYRALGVLCESLSHSDEWEVTRDWLASRRKEGREAISAAMQELESQGFALFICERNEVGKIVSVGWCFHEEAVPEDQRSNRTKWRTEPTERLPVRTASRPAGEPRQTGKPASIPKRQSLSKENQTEVQDTHADEGIPAIETSSPTPQLRPAPSSPAWAPEWWEVKEWADEKGWPIEQAAKFWNHYESIAWEVRGSKVKNWTARAQDWFNSWRQKAQTSQPAGVNL